jgi:RNA polymerase sigma-70 factor, ECF subfamily
MALRTPHRLGPTLGERERAYVFSVAMRYLKDPDAAEDVTQEAMLLAHRHRDSFRGDARYSTWLYRVAATAALMHLRKRRRIERAEAREDEDAERAPHRVETRDPSAGPAELCAARERLRAVEQRLAGLGAKYREVFWMRFGLDMTDGEVADALGVGLSTVKTRTHRTRLALRELAA